MVVLLRVFELDVVDDAHDDRSDGRRVDTQEPRRGLPLPENKVSPAPEPMQSTASIELPSGPPWGWIGWTTISLVAS